MNKYSLYLDTAYHCGVTLVRIFPHSFSDLSNVLLPRQCMLSWTIPFGLVVSDITPEIMRAHAHLKPMTCAEHFSGLKILEMHDQYAFLRFGMISTPQTLVC